MTALLSATDLPAAEFFREASWVPLRRAASAANQVPGGGVDSN
jgi:hypothetical protein